jgi:ketosteroid isomerase-like protein
MRTGLAVSLAACTILAGCGAAAHGPGPAATAGRQELKQAEKRGRELVEEAYKALRRGDVDSLHALLAQDVFAVGPASADVFGNRSDVVVALSSALARGKHKVSSRGLHVVSSPGGHSAWVADRLEIDGVPYRVTAVLSERDDFWVIDAIQLSRPAEKVAQTAWAGLPVAPPAAGADDVVTLVNRAVAEPGLLPEQLADSKDAMIIGSAGQPPTKSAKSIRKLWKKALNPPPRLKLEGPVRAGVGVDGTLGFALATVGVEDGAGKPEGQRFFFVYERERSGWKLIALHRGVIAK